jgi:hypothetical protein
MHTGELPFESLHNDLFLGAGLLFGRAVTAFELFPNGKLDGHMTSTDIGFHFLEVGLLFRPVLLSFSLAFGEPRNTS